MDINYFSNIPGNNTNLCENCKYAEVFEVAGDEVIYGCNKWNATVQNVGVCKYWEEKNEDHK